MHMIRYSCSASGSQIHPNIEPLRPIASGDPSHTFRDQLIDLQEFAVRKGLKVGGVTIGRDHEVPARVGIQVHEDEGSFTPVQNESLTVIAEGR